MNKAIYQPIFTGALALIATGAFAQVSSIGPFSGSYSENFDEFPSQQTQLFLPNPVSLFGGEATGTVTGGFPALAVYNPPTNPFGNYVPQSGSYFAVTQDSGDAVTFAFNDSMSEFGGYFGQDPLTVTFFDSLGGVISSGDYTPVDNGGSGTLEWLGWDSTQAFTSVEISSVNSITMDSLQASPPTPSPEPCSIALMIGGLAVAAKKRLSFCR